MSGKNPPWTGAELKTLRTIKDSGSTVKLMQHLLPNRTFIAIKSQMRRLPGGKKKRGRMSWVFRAMKRMLIENPGLTNAQIAKVIGCSRNAVCGVLNVEHGNSIYISGWTRAGSIWAACYSIGSLPDAPKPPKQTKEERYRAQKTKRVAKKLARNPFSIAMAQIEGSIFMNALSSTGRVFRQDI